MPRPTAVPYLEALLSELDDIEREYLDILERSAVVNVDPNRGRGHGVVFIGYASWGWAPSDGPLEAARLALLGRVRDWEPRFRLLFPHTTPQLSKRHDKSFARLEKWLGRPHGDRSVPSSIPAAVAALRESVEELRRARDLLPSDAFAARLVPDTNALIENPDLAAYTDELGGRYMAHVLPVVLRELDDLKRSGRTPELREAARKADRRLKGLRDNGDVRAGAKVAGDVWAVFEHIDPRGDGLPTWLDLEVPDDRLVASVLLLQSRHPGSRVYVATGDLNLQTKLAAVGLPHVEADEPDRERPA